jgi:ribosomal protein L24
MRKRIKAQADAPGFEVVMEAPLHYSNVMLVDPVSRKPVRSRAAWTESGDKTRVGVGRHASGAPLPKPKAWLQDAGPDSRVGAKDTPPEEALRVTRVDGLPEEEGAERAPRRLDYVAGKLAPPRPAWLPAPSAAATGEGGDGAEGVSPEEAAEAAALAYEERVEAWARRAYERGLLRPGEDQQVRRASTVAGGGGAEEDEEEEQASTAAAGRRRQQRQQQRQWMLARTGAPGLGPLMGRLTGVLSALRLS